MNAFKCVSCGADLPEIKGGKADCIHCGTSNFLDLKEKSIFLHSADGLVPVEIPVLMAVGLYLRSSGFHVRPDYHEWSDPIEDNTRVLRIAEDRSRTVTETRRTFPFTKVQEEVQVTEKFYWADLLVTDDNLVVISVPQGNLEKAKKLGVEIENSLGLPAKVHIDRSN